MHGQSQHSANVQIGEDHLSRSDEHWRDATARNIYPTRRGWHLGGRDRGGVRVLTAAGWAASVGVLS